MSAVTTATKFFSGPFYGRKKIFFDCKIRPFFKFFDLKIRPTKKALAVATADKNGLGRNYGLTLKSGRKYGSESPKKIIEIPKNWPYLTASSKICDFPAVIRADEVAGRRGRAPNILLD